MVLDSVFFFQLRPEQGRQHVRSHITGTQTAPSVLVHHSAQEAGSIRASLSDDFGLIDQVGIVDKKGSPLSARKILRFVKALGRERAERPELTPSVRTKKAMGVVFDDRNPVLAELIELFLRHARAEDEEHAVSLANDTVFGLNNSVFTNDPERALGIARRLRSGTVGYNSWRSDNSVGFGGFKQSGIGREGGENGLRAYLEPKTIIM